MDGANIVYRGVEGSGGAFLFPQTVPDAINIYERVKDRKLKNNLLQQKQLDQDMKMLAPTKAWAQDLPEFQKDRAEYLQFVTDAHKGKYTNDPNYLRKKDELRERIYAQQLRSSYHQKQYDEYVRDIAKNPEMYEDDALKKAEEYKNTMLHERPDNFVLPQLNPADGVKYFYSLTPPAKSNKGYKINADGTKTMTSSTSFDDKEAIRLAEKEYDNSDNKSVRAFKKQSDKMLISDLAAKGVDYFSLPAQEQEALRKEKFVEQAVDLMKIRFKPSYSENISNAPSNVSPRQVSLKEATTSNLYTPKQINTVASDGSGRPAVVQTEGTMEWPKGARGTGKVTLSKNSLYFDPVTNKFKKRTEAGNMDFEPGETSVIKMNDGTYKPYVFGKEVKLVKGTDSNGNPVQKTVKEDIAVPLDEVKNLANKNKVQYQWAFDLANEKNNKNKAAEKITVGKFKGVPKGGF